jgi:hypothetical protein
MESELLQQELQGQGEPATQEVVPLERLEPVRWWVHLSSADVHPPLPNEKVQHPCSARKGMANGMSDSDW